MGVKKEIEYRLTVGDLDRYDRLTPYSISNLFQEIASIHAEELGCGYDVMIAKNLAWIVARNRITIIDSNNVSKIVKVRTWPHPNGRFDFDRDYLLFDENDNLIAKGTSKWLVYDLKKNFLCSSKGIMEGIDFETNSVYDTKLGKIDYGNPDDYTFIYDHKIMYSDLDHYGHMNNAKYLVIMMNALNLDESQMIEDIQVDYINQGYFGKIISVYKKEVENEIYLLGKEEEKIIFAIKVKIKA